MISVTLNGVRVYPFSSLTDLITYASNQKKILVAINAEKVVMATDETRSIINNNIGYCDGVGAVKALHQLGHRDVIKIAGCELWLEIIKRYHAEKTFYLIGGKQEIIQETVMKLQDDFPDINIVGYHNGYINTPEEKSKLIEDVTYKKPDVVFVAMGSPKQELFMRELQKTHRAIYQGLGGSFDVYTGHVKRAPKWWLDHDLEFLYRVIEQPKRITRQLHYLHFAWWLFTGKFKREK